MPQRILVIDDEEGIRDAFLLALENESYEVDTAADGLEGLEKAEARRPDLVFLDLRMPRLDGVETLRRLKAGYPELPVHVLTAFHEDYLRPLQVLAAEGVEFDLTRKPIDAEQIRSIVAAILGHKLAIRYQ
jgi:CheY-like chemotaxis protein